ncbi:hypothetical protein Y032_0005g2417 [Ancylostoma ceylanicum]|uniref:Uncharacterized protein n=1 Tax=Ancylostoma ceylanicum TaxID=53326 RepID=A0A016VR89_9BILA|nr:hypothetical protein Y032_0005g2417 [Ancylostoma ceylanicum]
MNSMVIAQVTHMNLNYDHEILQDGMGYNLPVGMFHRQVHDVQQIRRCMSIFAKVPSMLGFLILNTMLCFRGNIVNNNIYNVGAPCTGCPTGAGGCNSSEGLCHP